MVDERALAPFCAESTTGISYATETARCKVGIEECDQASTSESSSRVVRSQAIKKLDKAGKNDTRDTGND